MTTEGSLHSLERKTNLAGEEAGWDGRNFRWYGTMHHAAAITTDKTRYLMHDTSHEMQDYRSVIMADQSAVAVVRIWCEMTRNGVSTQLNV